VTPAITYCSAVCPVNNTTNDISSDIDLKIQITEKCDCWSHYSQLLVFLSRCQNLCRLLYCLLDKQLNSMLLMESLFSVICIFKSTTNDISSDIDLKISITEIRDSSNNILFSCLFSKQYNRTDVVCCIVY
jgi:hypothetical protein